MCLRMWSHGSYWNQQPKHFQVLYVIDQVCINNGVCNFFMYNYFFPQALKLNEWSPKELHHFSHDSQPMDMHLCCLLTALGKADQLQLVKAKTKETSESLNILIRCMDQAKAIRAIINVPYVAPAPKGMTLQECQEKAFLQPGLQLISKFQNAVSLCREDNGSSMTKFEIVLPWVCSLLIYFFFTPTQYLAQKVV